MAARKIKPPKTASSEGRAFVVVLEEIHAQNRGFGEGVARAIGGIGQDIGEIRQDIVEVRRDMGEMRQDIVEMRQDIVEMRQDIVEVRHDIVEIRHDVGLVTIAVLDHSRELKQLGR
jgi:uncharacterized coiled-coil DUF342 family protein